MVCRKVTRFPAGCESSGVREDAKKVTCTLQGCTVKQMCTENGNCILMAPGRHQ